LGAGAPAAETAGLVRKALRVLREDAVIPWFITNVQVRGEDIEIPVFKGDDTDAVARRFVEMHGLGDEETAFLRKHLGREASKHRMVPLMRIPISVPGDQGDMHFELFHGDQVRDRVEAFSRENGLGSSASASLLEHATRFAAQAGLVPFARVTPSFQDAQGKQLPELQVWAGSNISEAVRDYVDDHMLTPEQERDVAEAVTSQGKGAGVLPLLSIGLQIESSVEDGAAAVPATFQLFEGDELSRAVDVFSERLNLTAEGHEALLARVTLAAQAERLIPVLKVSTEFPRGDGEPATVAVAIFNGDDPATTAAAAASAAGVTEAEASRFASLVLKRARQERLLPAFRLRPPSERGEPVFEAYVGDNVTELAESFCDTHRLGPKERQLLLDSALLQAKEAGMEPVLTVPVRIQMPGSGALLDRELELYKDEDLRSKIREFGLAFELGDESLRKLEGHVIERALSEGLLPVMSVPFDVPAEGAGQLAGEVDVFRGDSAETAARRLFSRLGWDPAGGRLEAVTRVVEDAGKSRGVFPVLERNISVSGLTEPVPAVLFKGTNITSLADELAQRHGLTGPARAELEDSIRSLAVRERAVPMLVIPVSLGEDRTEQLSLFLGDNLTHAVREWGQQRGLTEDELAQLQSSAMRRAQASRLIPVLSLMVRVGGGPNGEARLSMYQGDNVTATVRAFMERHGIDPSREQELVGMMHGAAVDNRVLPEHELPIRLETPSGALDSVFALFRGDDPREQAERFLERHSVSKAALPDLLSFLQQRLPGAIRS